jgi:hypothetical protein
MNDHIRIACSSFIDFLSDKELESDELFTMLDKAAKKRGYHVAAEQRGIHGTFLHFVKS